jgi:uncharacterized protein (DUF362 family)/Pyruvate/2-oxoacid:ferredoxin oxidoreductase delta subunit
MHHVAVESVAGYDRAEVKAGLCRLLAHLGGMSAFVKPGERVLLKPNLLSAKPPEAAVTTHPELVRAVIELVREAGGIPIVGDSPGVGGLSRVAEKSGVLAVLRETGTELVQFDEPLLRSGSGVFKRFELARPYLEADRVINLPKLKTHEMMTMTCAVKNLFGAVVGAAKVAWHLKAGDDRDLFARLLLEIYQLRKPDLNIVDAIVAMEGNGPSGGAPRQVGLLLAGVNGVAVDVIAGELLGIPEKRLYVERAARRLQLDGADRATVRTSGVPLDEVRVSNFLLPTISDVQFGLPPIITRRLRHLVTAFPCPLPGKCRLCGVCRAACPPGAITHGHREIRIDYRTCIRCFCCRELCPYDALGVREGWLLRFIKKYI